MRILAINWQDIQHTQAGGAEIHITEILTRLVKKGHRATLFCSSFAGAPKEVKYQGLQVIRRGSRLNFNWVLPFYLPEVLKRERFDIVLEDINKMPFFSPLFHRLPTLVIFLHFFGKTIFRETNPIFGSYVWLGEKLVPVFYRKFPFLTISNSSRDDLIDHGIKEEQITVLSPGISDLYFDATGTDKKTAVPTIVYLGRIKKYKGVQQLVLALPRIREKIGPVKLLIVGSGDYLPDLKKLAQGLNLSDSVHFTGYVSEEEKLKILRQAWVSVYPSLKEGWGLTNIEANACGTAVLASNVPGLRDSVINGQTGLLFRYGDIDDLTEKLTNLLSDQPYRARLIKAGLDWARKFSWDETADRVAELLEKVIRERSYRRLS